MNFKRSALVLTLGMSLASARAQQIAPPAPVKATGEPTVSAGAPEPTVNISKERARALQDYGLPPVVYVEDPSSLEEKQAVVALYSLEKSSPTDVGGRLLDILDCTDPAKVKAITQKKFFMMLLAVKDLVTREKDPRYQANPELLLLYQKKVNDIIAKEIPGDTDLAGLGKSGRSLRDVLAQRQEVLDLVIAHMQAAPDQDKLKDQTEFFKRVKAEMATLRMDKDGKPLLPGTLYHIVQAIPEKDLTQAQWKTLIESYPMGQSLWQDRIDRLWRRKLDGKGITIALLDTGSDKSHPFLDGHVFDGDNFTNHRYIDHDHKDAAGQDLFGKPDNRGGHGTHTAGTIAAYAPQAKIINIKVLDEEARKEIPPELQHDLPMTIDSIKNGLQSVYEHNQAVASGALKGDRIDVVSMSLGIPGSNTGVLEGQNVDELSAWVSKLAKQGVVVVVAGGNDGAKVMGRPGFMPDAITVGAVDYFGRVTAFSSDQTVMDPKDAAVTEKPDIWSWGHQVISSKYDPAGYKTTPGSGLSMGASGTSMSTPHTAVVAGLILQAGRAQGVQLTPDQVKRAMMATADPLANGNPYYNALSGRLDPNKAVDYVGDHYAKCVPDASKPGARCR